MDADDITELFRDFGPVTVRRMFSGAGVHAEGMNFAFVVDGMIYLKTDAETAADFDREKLAAFTFRRKGGKEIVTSYRRMPDRCYDEPEEAAHWARGALGVARRAQMRKRPAAKRSAKKVAPNKRPVVKARTSKTSKKKTSAKMKSGAKRKSRLRSRL